jgi:ABC-type sulfate transport system permease subunit
MEKKILCFLCSGFPSLFYFIPITTMTGLFCGMMDGLESWNGVWERRRAWRIYFVFPGIVLKNKNYLVTSPEGLSLFVLGFCLDFPS